MSLQKQTNMNVICVFHFLKTLSADECKEMKEDLVSTEDCMKAFKI